MRTKFISRREVLKILGAVGAIGIVGCGEESGSDTVTGSTCVLTPTLTEGPYFVDERLNRSNIIGGQPGLPLNLAVKIYNASSSACSAISSVQVDIWHTNGIGAYSGVPGLGTGGQTFLRGYQVTDSNGNVSFATIYPGWYSGRATHIHLKARIFNAAGNATLEATTQIFFDDATSDSVYSSNAPYNSRGARDTRNSQDGIYGSRTSLLVPLTGSNNVGYSGAVAIGIAA